VHKSPLLRDLVPPTAAQLTLINLIEAVATSDPILDFPAWPLFPFCIVGPSRLKPPIAHECRIEI